jgi:hypothetical protein
VKGLIRNQDGFVTIWVLLFIPIFAGIAIFTLTHTQAVTGADINLQGAINSAVTAAAGQVTDDSQAAGTPKIHSDRAHAAFRAELARNLGLNETTMQPLTGSMVASPPEYCFIVYNGDAAFALGGALRAVKYSLQGGVLSSGPFIANGFPCNYTISENNILLGSGGSIDVTLDYPGVIAVLKIKQASVYGNEDLNIVRWGSAKVVTNH